MVLLPVTNPLGVFLIPEVILVLWFGQPSSLRLALARFTALGLQAIALALSIPIIRKKKFLAVKAFASGWRRLHRVPNQGATSIGNRKNQAEANPPGRKLITEKKEEDFSANARRKCQGRRSNSRPAVLIQFYFTADTVRCLPSAARLPAGYRSGSTHGRSHGRANAP
jgi:hypothetical protein